jgi:glycosyltransferase involved in cell wall biosynthesis
METQPLVSIIIPAYNAEQFIDETINSICKQTYKNLEVIIVDDSSTDKTVSLVNAWKKDFITCIPNDGLKGSASARNTGIKKASGKYIAFFDADDIMFPGKIEKQVEVLEKDLTLDICSASMQIYLEKPVDIAVSGNYNICKNLQKNPIILGNSVIKTSFIKDNNLFFNDDFTNYADDYDWEVDAVKNYHAKIFLLPEVVAFYRQHKNQCSRKEKIIAQNHKKIMEKYNLNPLVSIIPLDDSRITLNMNGNEVVKTIREAKGEYILFHTINKSHKDRIDVQYKKIKELNVIGLGTFLDLAINNSIFYHPTVYHIIKSELYAGNIPFEQSTFMFKNLPELQDEQEIIDIDFTVNKDLNFFKLICILSKYGRLANIPTPLVNCDVRIPPIQLEQRINYANKFFENEINAYLLNIGNFDNFSGVDNYIDLLEENIPLKNKQINIKTINFKLTPENIFGIKTNPETNNTVILYSNNYLLEHQYELIWDSIKDLFRNQKNIIIHYNTFNLYSFALFIRNKINCKLLFTIHCIPFRDAIQKDRNKYKELEEKYRNPEINFRQIEDPGSVEAIVLADHVINLSQHGIEYLNKLSVTKNYTTIPHGVKATFKAIEKEKDIFTWIFVGHGGQLKGINQLIPIVKQVKEKTSISFKILWAGKNNKTILDLIKLNDVPIISLGIQNKEQLCELYNTSNGMLICTACEMLGYMALEGLSYGLPIIGTNTYGINELLNNDAGILVPISIDGIIDQNKYVDAMVQVMSDKKLQHKLKINALKKAEKYTLDKMIDKTAQLYKKLI